MTGRQNRRTNWRLMSFLIILLCAYAIVSARLVELQAIDSEEYQKRARDQRVRKIEIAPRRGTVFDRSNEEIAVSISVDSIYANPKFIRKKEVSAQRIAAVLGQDPKDIKEKLDRDCGFVYLVRKVDKPLSNKVASLDIQGVGALEDSKRCYPYGNLAAQLIGFAGMENKGLSGLELYYDKILRGNPGELVIEKDPMGKPIPSGLSYSAPPSDGNDIVLTIDKDIQFKAEQALKNAVQASKAKSGIIIAMEPNTGEILAMVNYPEFDPNNVTGVPQEMFRNRAVTDLYEPGSTMKVVTASAALEEKVVETQTVFHLPSELKVADRIIGEAHERGAIDLSVADIVVKSSNVGIVKIAQKLQKERLYNYIEKFGLTSPTGLDYPGEAKGLCPKPHQWSGSTIGNIPFGQGISVSALQSLRAVAVVANGGWLVQPYLLKEVRDKNKKAVGAALRKAPQRVISKETSDKMKCILADVVRKGTAKQAALSDYAVAGKTGTAQKPSHDGNGYEEGKYIASFVGFVPADTPRLAIIIIIDEPKTEIWGGTLAAPVFRGVAEFSLRHMKVAPNFVAAD